MPSIYRVCVDSATEGVLLLTRPTAVVVQRVGSKKHAPYAYSTPGGWLKKGESAATAALRELREEVGIIGSLPELLFSVADGVTTTHIVSVRISRRRWPAGLHLTSFDTSEFIKAYTILTDELHSHFLELYARGECIDPNISKALSLPPFVRSA